MKRLESFLYLIIAITWLNSVCVYSLLGSEDDQTVRFHIFTSDNRNKSFDLKKNPESVHSICDPSSRPLYKLIVHGFAETWNMTYRWDWVKDLKYEMFKNPEGSKICYIAMDWKELAKGGSLISNYWKAISNMDIAGEIVSTYLNSIKINEKNIHCIGFSLGAHMCGIFGKTYYKKYKIKIGRITGLDPAGPFFKPKPNTEKLYETDADLVDIIHTSDKFGLIQRNGHMDFYPDSGPSEISSCDDTKTRFENYESVILYEEENNNKKKGYDDITLSDKQVKDIGEFNFFSLDSLLNSIKGFFRSIKDFFYKKPKRVFVSVHQFLGCSHLMAVRYFLYSINDCIYQAAFCRSRFEFEHNTCFLQKNTTEFPRMGYFADRAANTYKISKGSFFLNATDKPPYCKDKIEKNSLYLNVLKKNNV